MGFLKQHLTALIMLGVGVAVITGGFIFLRSHTNAVSRDLERLSDMHILRSSFVRMYQDDASYANAGCKEGDQAHFCMLEAYDPNVVVRQDPSGASYLVSKTPDGTSYAITFSLERSYKNLAAGEHALSEQGIQ